MSISHTVIGISVHRSQRLTCSGFVMASNTRCRGASNIRVMAISRSDGVVIFRVLSILASTLLLLDWLRLVLPLALRSGFRGLIGLQFFQIIVEAIEVLVPEAAETSEPAIDRPKRDRRDTAWPPLRLAPARDQAGMFQHLEMFRDCRKADVERFGKLHHRRFAERQPRQDRPPRRIGECCESRAERVGRHLCLAYWLNNLWVKYGRASPGVKRLSAEFDRSIGDAMRAGVFKGLVGCSDGMPTEPK